MNVAGTIIQTGYLALAIVALAAVLMVYLVLKHGEGDEVAKLRAVAEIVLAILGKRPGRREGKVKKAKKASKKVSRRRRASGGRRRAGH